jgi:hypothetical protein
MGVKMHRLKAISAFAACLFVTAILLYLMLPEYGKVAVPSEHISTGGEFHQVALSNESGTQVNGHQEVQHGRISQQIVDVVVKRWPDKATIAGVELSRASGTAKDSPGVSRINDSHFRVALEGADVCRLVAACPGYDPRGINIDLSVSHLPLFEVLLQPQCGYAFQVRVGNGTPVHDAQATVSRRVYRGPYAVSNSLELDDLQLVMAATKTHEAVGEFSPGVEGYVYIPQERLPAMGVVDIAVQSTRGTGQDSVSMPCAQVIGEPIILQTKGLLTIRVECEGSVVPGMSLCLGTPSTVPEDARVLAAEWHAMGRTNDKGESAFSVKSYPVAVRLAETSALEIDHKQGTIYNTHEGRAIVVREPGTVSIQVIPIQRVNGNVNLTREGRQLGAISATIHILGRDDITGGPLDRELQAKPDGTFSFKYIGTGSDRVYAEIEGIGRSELVLLSEAPEQDIELSIECSADAPVISGVVYPPSQDLIGSGDIELYGWVDKMGRYRRLANSKWSEDGVFAIVPRALSPDARLCIVARSDEGNLWAVRPMEKEDSDNLDVRISLVEGCTQVIRIDRLQEWINYRIDVSLLDDRLRGPLPLVQAHCSGADGGSAFLTISLPPNYDYRAVGRKVSLDSIGAALSDEVGWTSCGSAVAITLNQLQRVRGVVHGYSGDKDLYIACVAPGRDSAYARVGKDGVFEISGLVHSSYRLFAYVPNGSGGEVLGHVDVAVTDDIDGVTVSLE